MATTLTAHVGRNRPNRPADVKVVVELLNKVPANKGGPDKPLGTNDFKALVAAIRKFQKHYDGKSDGWIHKSGKHLAMLRSAAGEAPGKKAFVGLLVPQKYRYAQGDRRWQNLRMNNSTNPNHRLIVKGCALTSVASAFAAKGVKITNTGGMADVLKRKSKWLQGINIKSLTKNSRQLKTISPVTLEAWMTANSSQGYSSTSSINLHWKKVAAIGTGVQFESWRMGKGKIPSAAALRDALNARKVIIAHIPPHHFVVLTGHNGRTKFYCWDVGYFRPSYAYSSFDGVVIFTG